MPPHLALLKFHWHKTSTTVLYQTPNLIWIILLFSCEKNYINICLFSQCSLASYITDDEIQKGILFPEVSRWASPATARRYRTHPSNHFFLLIVLWTPYPFSTDGWLTSTKRCSIRHITARVGAAVVRAAVAEDLAEGCRTVGPKELGSMSEVLYYAEINFTFV